MQRRDLLRGLVLCGAIAATGPRIVSAATEPGRGHVTNAWMSGSHVYAIRSGIDSASREEYAVVDNELVLVSSRPLLAAAGFSIFAGSGADDANRVLGTLAEQVIHAPAVNADVIAAEDLLLLPEDDSASAVLPWIEFRHTALLARAGAQGLVDAIPLVPTARTSAVLDSTLVDTQNAVALVAVGDEAGPLGRALLVDIASQVPVVQAEFGPPGELAAAALGDHHVVCSSVAGETVVEGPAAAGRIPMDGYVSAVLDTGPVLAIDMHDVESRRLWRWSYLSGTWHVRELVAISGTRPVQNGAGLGLGTTTAGTAMLVQREGQS